MRRMLKLDPNERASIPEIFNHSWLRFRNVTTLDHQVPVSCTVDTFRVLLRRIKFILNGRVFFVFFWGGGYMIADF